MNDVFAYLQAVNKTHVHIHINGHVLHLQPSGVSRIIP